MSTIEFWPWEDIPENHRRVVGGEREVLGLTFAGDRAWLPWMGTDDGERWCDRCGVSFNVDDHGLPPDVDEEPTMCVRCQALYDLGRQYVGGEW